MQAIILGGGEGIKLRPLTFSLPKPLLPLINKPVLDYIIYILKAAGINKIILTVDYLSSDIKKYVQKNDFGIPIEIYPIVKYTGSAQVLKALEPKLEAEFIVVFADCLYDLSLKEVISYFQKAKAKIGMVVRKEKDILGKGGFILANNEVSKIISPKKYQANAYSDAWIYYFKKEVLKLIPAKQSFEIHLDLIKKALKNKIKILTYNTENFWAVIGRVHTYLAANFWILQNIGTDSYVGANSVIDPSAKLIPPYFIEENCVVGKDTALGPNVILGKNSQVKNGTTADNTIIHHNTIINENCSLQKCIVSHDCIIGKNTKIGKLAIVASNCQIGAHSILEDGSRVGPDLKLPAKSHIKDFIFPSQKTEQKAKKEHLAGLSPEELKIYRILKSAGEQTLEGISSSLKIQKSILQKSLQALIKKNIVISYAQEPVIYTLNTHLELRPLSASKCD